VYNVRQGKRGCTKGKELTRRKMFLKPPRFPENLLIALKEILLFVKYLLLKETLREVRQSRVETGDFKPFCLFGVRCSTLKKPGWTRFMATISLLRL